MTWEWIILTAGILAAVFARIPLHPEGYDKLKEWAFTAVMAVGALMGAATGSLPAPGGPGAWLLLCFVLLASISVLWSDFFYNARVEIPRLFAILYFLFLASTLPRDPVLWSLWVPAPFVALYGLSQQLLRKDLLIKEHNAFLRKKYRFFGWSFGSNQAGTYLAPMPFIGMYLVTLMPWPWSAAVYFGVALCAFGLWHSHCKGAIVANLIGTMVLAPWAIPLILIAAAAFVWKRRALFDGAGHRVMLLRICLEMFKHKPLLGWGPRSFRTHHHVAVAAINKRDPSILGKPGVGGKYAFWVGRRAHNDFAETFADYGLVGGLLFLGFIALVISRAISSEPMLLAGVVAAVSSAAFFYPWRQIDVGLPLFVLLGINLQAAPIAPPPAVALIVAVAAGAILWEFCAKPYWSMRAALAGRLPEALTWQPFATEYLFLIAQLAVKVKDAALAFNCAEKALYHYDGDRPYWEILNIFGAAAAMAGAITTAEHAFRRCLTMHPNYKPARRALEQLQLYKLGKLRPARKKKKPNRKKEAVNA